MVTDTELVNRLHQLLRRSDLDTATTTTVRRTLEIELGIDLTDRKAYIREQIDLFLNSHLEKPQETPHRDDPHLNDNDSVSQEQEPDEEEEAEQEDEEEEEEEEEEKSDGKRSDKSDKDVKKTGRGFSKPCALSPQLQKLVGEPELARTEVVKKIWVYIKEKNLQNPKNKRKILCDEILHGIFRVKSIDMFQMNRALTKHIWPLDEEDAAPVKPLKKKRQNREDTEEEDSDAPKQKKRQNREDTEEEDSDAPKQKKKQVKGKGSGFLSPLPISDALGNFFGTGDKAISRSEVVKRMWKYIKQHDLQDPSDKRRILCDDKLRELLEVDSFIGFTVSKLLSPHFIKEA